MVAVFAPGGAGLLRSSHEGGPRDDEGLFGETVFWGFFFVRLPLFSIFEGIHSFLFLVIFLLPPLCRGGGVFRAPRANSAGGVVVVGFIRIKGH